MCIYKTNFVWFLAASASLSSTNREGLKPKNPTILESAPLPESVIAILENAYNRHTSTGVRNCAAL